MDAIQIGFEHLTQTHDVLLGAYHQVGAAIAVPHLDWIVFAQEVRDPDVLGQMQKALQTFIESGQVWALIIGLVLGFGFRSMLP